MNQMAEKGHAWGGKGKTKLYIVAFLSDLTSASTRAANYATLRWQPVMHNVNYCELILPETFESIQADLCVRHSILNVFMS